MSEDYQDVMDEVTRNLKLIPIDECPLLLKRRGLNIIESIKLIRTCYSVSLADSKKVVSSSSAWIEEVQAADGLHQAFEEVADLSDFDNEA